MAENPTETGGLKGHRLVRRRTARYLESLRWMIITLFRFRPVGVALIVGLAAVGRSMQAAAFAAVIWYFTSVEKNRPIEYLGWSIDPRSGETMALVVVGVAAALVAATFVIYLSARAGFFLSMSFAEVILEKVLTQEGAFPTRTKLGRNGTMALQALELLNAKIMLFRPVNVLLGLPRSILLAVPAIFGMIWIAGEVVAFLVLLAVPAVALNYVISHRVVRVQHERRSVQREYKNSVRDVTDVVAEENRRTPDRTAGVKELADSEPNKNFIQTFATRLLSPRQSEFVSNVLAAVAVVSIGLYLGTEALSGTIPLSLVVGFFVLLRIAISGLTSIAVSLTTYARFYGMIRSAYEYLSSPLQTTERFTGQPVLHAAKQETPAPGALEDGVRVERGAPVAIVSPAEINRYTQYFFALALTQRSRQSTREKLNAATLRCTAMLAEPESLAAHGLAGPDVEALKARIEAAGISKIAPSLETLAKAADPAAELKPLEVARIALLTAVLSKADLILMEPRLVAKLPVGELKLWIEALSDRFIALCYRFGPFQGCMVGEAYAILLDDEHAVAVVKAEDAVKAAQFVQANLKPEEEGEGDMDVME